MRYECNICNIFTRKDYIAKHKQQHGKFSITNVEKIHSGFTLLIAEKDAAARSKKGRKRPNEQGE